MRKSLLFFAAASLLLAGCAKEQLVEEKLSNGVVTEVSATFEALVPDGATKASVSISENTGTFSWQEDDAAAFVLDGKTAYGKGTYNANSQMFQIQGAANSHHDAVYPYDLVGSTSPSTEHVTSVTVPSTRDWTANQTNVAMYGTYTSDKYTFKHLGGLVKVTVVNVPTAAKTFVFKTAGKKINGTFTVETDGGEKVIKTNSTPAEGEDIYTLNLPSTITANSTMDFYVPLPVGDGYKFAFYLKDDSSKDLVKIEGTTAQTVARKSILVMPTITLAAASIEDIYKAATIQEVPAGHSGDFLLAKSESVILKLMSSTDDKDITLKYNGVELPKNLKIVVEGDNYFDAKISGSLPKTHVDFTEGEIKEAAFTTNNSTFSIVYPAKISDKLTVGGGNVVIEGAKVGAIEVAEGAKADPTGGTGNVKITMKAATVESQKIKPEVVGTIVANANIEVAPAQGVEVFVEKADNVVVDKVSGSKGEVVTIENDAVVMIGSQKYETLTAAIDAVTEGQTIKVLKDISNANGISVAKDANKNFTVDFGGHTYTCLDNPAGSTNTTNQVFQLNAGNTIIFKNGTINVAETNNTKFKFIIQNYADLTLEDMTLDGTNLAKDDYRYTLSNNAGNINLTGKTSIKAAAERGVAFDIYYWKQYYPTAPVLTWNSTGDVEGKIELSGASFIVEKDLKLTTPIRTTENANGTATLTVKSGATISPKEKFKANVHTQFTGTSATFNEYAGGVVIVNRGADLKINGAGTITTTNNEEWCYAAVCLTEKKESEAEGAAYAKLTVEGTVKLEGYYYGICGNGSRGNTEITINGGTIKGLNGNDCTGIYHPQKGKLTISGGEIEGATGIYVKSGDVTASITAGTVKGNGSKDCLAYNPDRTGDGCDPTGDALVIDNCGYPGGQPTVSILGGTFISTNHKAVASYAKTGYPTVTGFINGGTFSDLSGVKYVADNATYTLGADVANAAGMTLDTKKTFTVDFGGHTYTVNKPGAGSTNTQTQAFQLIAGQNITFKNGTIKAADANLNATSEGDVKPIKRFIQNYANLTLTNMTFDGTNINGENSVVEFCNGNVTIDGTTNFTAKSGVASINVDSWKGSYPNGTAVTINTTGNVGKIHCYTEGTGSMTTKSSLTIKNGKNITIDDVSNGEVVVSIEGGTFSDLSGVKYIADNKTYTLGADVTNAVGMAFDTKKTFTVDFGGHTYTVNKPGAGSTNTQTLAFQLLAGQTITFKNGTIKAATENLNATESDGKKPIKRFIQNYANLTLTDMTLDGTNINGDNSVVEFCNGNVVVDGSTNFTAKTNVASINVDSWTAYPNGTNVTINTTGKVGKIYCYSEGTGSMTTKSKLTIVSGEDITIEHKTEGDVDVDDQRTK